MQRILSRVPRQQKLQLVWESAWALCLKFRCAKPLQHASSYVFWKLTVLERRPREYRDGREWRWEKRAGCVLQCGKPRKRHLRSDTDTPCAAGTGSRQTSAQTWATGKPRPALA